MTQLKEEVIALIQALPDDYSLEDIQYHLSARAKVERGIRAIGEGRTVSQEEAEEKVRGWVNLPAG
jgi:predicted transcriptional regulator